MRPRLLASMGLLCVSCAKVGLPSGGPVDKQAPRIVSHYPAADALEVARDAVIELAFSEAMDRERTEEALFVSPAGPLHLRWRGARLQVAMPLAEGRTYVVTVGTGARDLRGNSLEQSFTLAFATGDQLDQGAVRGRVYREHEPAARAHVWAYDLGTFSGRVGFDEPSYKTQSGGDGGYEFARLAEGRYRVLAFVDENRNALPDAEEWLALSAADVEVGADEARAGDLALERTKVAAPTLERAQAAHAGRVLLVFSAPVDPAALAIEFVELAVEGVYAAPGSGEKIYVETAPQEPGRDYRIERLALAGAPVAWDEPIRGSARADRKPPELVAAPDLPHAPGDTLELFFTEALADGEPLAGWNFKGEATAPTGGSWSLAAPNRARFVPDQRLPPDNYHLVVDDTSRPPLMDRAGNALADSLAYSFAVAAATAGINGRVLTAATGTVWVEAIGPGDRKYRTTADAVGHFALDGLLAGAYTLWAFVDADGDGGRGTGALDPFARAEPYGRYAEPLDLEVGQAVEVEIACY